MCEVEQQRSYEHKQQTTTKCRRSQKKNDRIREGLRDHNKDKKMGVDYGSGIGYARSQNNSSTINSTSSSPLVRLCPACGLAGHSRRTHRSCLKYKQPTKKAKVAANGGQEETTQNDKQAGTEQAGTKILEKVSSIEKNNSTEKNDAYVNRETEILRKVGERESKLASSQNMLSESVSLIEETNSVEWLTDEVLKVDEMDFDDDANINSDTSDTEIE